MTGGTREVQATFWLLDAPASLLLQSENQPDGVGLGTFKADGTSNVYRKPVAANRSETFITGALNVRSATFLSHIRHATVAEPSLENTHPFEQNGRLMAHNGVIGDVPELRRRLGASRARAGRDRLRALLRADHETHRRARRRCHSRHRRGGEGVAAELRCTRSTSW